MKGNNQLSRYEPSSPSTKELHGLTQQTVTGRHDQRPQAPHGRPGHVQSLERARRPRHHAGEEELLDVAASKRREEREEARVEAVRPLRRRRRHGGAGRPLFGVTIQLQVEDEWREQAEAGVARRWLVPLLQFIIL